MSFCFGCGSKFGLFKREHACRNCGRVHCSKCLTNKVLLRSQVEQEVCKRCFDAFRQQEIAANKYQNKPHIGRSEAYGAPPPYHGGEGTGHSKVHSQAEKNIETDPDVKIRERLEKLKDKDLAGPKCSEKDVNERFAELTGREPASTRKSDILTPRPKLSEQEEINRLMESAMAEASLERVEPEPDGEKNSVNDIENRLLKLKGVNPESVKKSEAVSDSSEDEAEATANVIRKALAEARIDEKVHAEGYGVLIDADNSKRRGKPEDDLGLPAVPTTPVSFKIPFAKKETEGEGELPWCCICNNDATLRCHGCDDDLYCRRCYKEGHSKFDMTDHQTSRFKAPNE